MIISIYNGSPRKNGNTAFATQQIFRQLENLRNGQIKLYNISDYKIDPCYGCRQCMELYHCCNQKDDFEILFHTVRNSDITIWGVPVYWFAPPGITKNFIDRTHGYFLDKGLLTGKRAYLVNIATDSGFRTNEAVMRSWLEWLGVKIVEVMDVYATETDDIKNDELKIKQINRFIKNIIKEIAK